MVKRRNKENRIGNEYLVNLRFSGDFVLLARPEMKNVIEEVNRESLPEGLKMNKRNKGHV